MEFSLKQMMPHLRREIREVQQMQQQNTDLTAKVAKLEQDSSHGSCKAAAEILITLGEESQQQ